MSRRQKADASGFACSAPPLASEFLERFGDWPFRVRRALNFKNCFAIFRDTKLLDNFPMRERKNRPPRLFISAQLGDRRAWRYDT